MRRSSGLQRKTPRRRTPLVHYSPLGREGQLSIETREATADEYMHANGRKRKRGRRGEEKRRRAAWAAHARGKRCAVCGHPGCRPVAGHHLLRVQVLRKEAGFRGFDFDVVLWDLRNQLPVGEPCHAAHHNASRRIPRAVLETHTPEVFDFARELGLEWALDREYPSAGERMEAVA
jgi:hypothetical protein